MCKALAEDGRDNLSQLTKSCDSPHRQQPVQCGYCSSCLLRRQALAAANIEDGTRYVVLYGNRPAADPSLHFRSMLSQVCSLQRLLSTSDEPSLQWEALTGEFPVMDDIVDRSIMAEGILPTIMQNHLIQLYRTYISEWDAVASRIATGLTNEHGNQQVSNRCLTTAQQS